MLSIRALTTKLINLCVRAVVTRSGERYQVQWLGDRITSLVEHFQPQGLHFRVPIGAEAMLISPCGEASASVLLGAHKRSAMPQDVLAEGEGGLHYLGTYAVFVKADGTVHLGGGIAAAEPVALANKLITAIANMLAAGVGATGTEAFVAAAAAWTAVHGPPPEGGPPPTGPTFAASKVKAT